MLQPALDLRTALRVGQVGRRDYLDVTRRGFLVRGVSSQPVSVVNLIKVAEGGAPAVNRCPSQQSHLQPSDSSCPHDIVLPALESPYPSSTFASSVFCVKGGLQRCFSLSLLIFPDLQTPPELSAPSGSYIVSLPGPTCLDQSSQGAISPGENTPLYLSVTFDINSGHSLEYLLLILWMETTLNSSCKLQSKKIRRSRNQLISWVLNAPAVWFSYLN